MLKKFSVKNFKNFKNELVLDFSKVRDYEFNQHLVKNDLINKMVIYGPNNAGKSNLGAALMDITIHLTDNSGKQNPLYNYYLSGNGTGNKVSFKYDFVFDNQEVTYVYHKDSHMKLLDEELICDGKVLVSYNYKNNTGENNIKEARTLNINQANINSISVLKYIYSNTLSWNETIVFQKFMEFVNKMLWFRSVRGNEYIGLEGSVDSLGGYIISNGLLNDFQNFLQSAGQTFELEAGSNNIGKPTIMVKYNKGYAEFGEVASTGTLSLWLFYYWLHKVKNISFVFLDEFDAFYHYELSTFILKYINNRPEFQSILTTHNTFLIDNELMRPDCYMQLKDGKIASFADSTNKKIRQGHNLEKMMIGGEFEK